MEREPISQEFRAQPSGALLAAGAFASLMLVFTEYFSSDFWKNYYFGKIVIIFPDCTAESSVAFLLFFFFFFWQ
jgi:hypothetical protein